MNIQQILFLDIETVPCAASYDELPIGLQPFWDHKAAIIDREGTATPDELFDRAGIYAEFGRIVCISVGYIHEHEGKMHMHIKSFASVDEKELLEKFAHLLQTIPSYLLCAHNGKEFDFPFICRRMVIQGIEIPELLQIMGKKPWQVPHMDTMEMWKFGDRKSFTSLALLAEVMGIPTPKDDMDGSMVREVFKQEGGIDKIVTYCQKDVVALIQVFLRFMNRPLIPEELIIYK
jgi:uncharacterized protein YprB with RNaseH-like and TPR domain